MSRWLDTCMQPVPVDDTGMAVPKRCPCSMVKSCPDCSLECLQGKKWCMFWTTKSGKQRRHVYDYFLYKTLEDSEIAVYTSIPTPFTCCHICMYRIKVPYYSSLLGEYKPFEETVEDLPF